MRAAPVASLAESDPMDASASDALDDRGERLVATRGEIMASRKSRDGLICSDDTVLITHIDGRRFLNLEQRAERGLPAHIPKYDA
jgi:hypothetical protein